MALGAAEYSVREDGSIVRVTVIRNGSSAIPVITLLSTLNGSATGKLAGKYKHCEELPSQYTSILVASDDYSPLNGMEISHASDISLVVVEIVITNDEVHEAMETFYVRLTLPEDQMGVQVDNSMARIDIFDDDSKLHMF